MRLTHFAFALTLILVAITGYLAWEGQAAARGAREELEFVKKQQDARETARPQASAMIQVPTSIAPPAIGTLAESSEPTSDTMTLPGGGLTVPKTVIDAESKGISTNTLTPTQKLVLAAQPLAKVKTVIMEQGFVIIDAGSKQGIAKGQPYEIRRAGGVLARIKIADTVEPDEAVADLDLASIPVGVQIEPGDEIIQPVAR
jgi:hypothetical protein